ncbi:hypothetical protein [Caenimonas koreensis]|uniref:hypothetical protein n=1 Tax=Caenimonas koreensis TaxID=367474 RepID=UPI0037838E58
MNRTTSTRPVTFHVAPEPDFGHPIDERTPRHRPMQVETPNPPRAAANPFRRPGRSFTTWNTEQTLGTLVEEVPMCVLGRPLHKLGDLVQDGMGRGPGYNAGCAIHGVANVIGGTVKLLASAVSTAEQSIHDLMDALVRVPAASTLAVAESVMPASIARACVQLGDDIVNSSAFMQRGTQVRLTADEAARVRVPAALAFVTSCATPYAGPLPVDRMERAAVHELPQDILPRGHAAYPNGTGKLAKFHYDAEAGQLSGGPWAPLRVGVYIDRHGGGTTYFLVFTGLNFPKQKGLLKSLVAQGIGIADSAFEDADTLVRAFRHKCQAEGAALHLVGHSLGGAFAQYAGIGNNVQVTAFNSAGLSVHLRNKLGSRRIDEADVEHFNSEDDWLSQKLEGRFSPVITTQVGRRYVIEGTSGHRMDAFPQVLGPTELMAPAMAWLAKFFNDVSQGNMQFSCAALNETQIMQARDKGVRRPERVRLMVAPALPAFPDESVRLALQPLVSRSSFGLMTLDYWIWMTHETSQSPEFDQGLLYEFERVRQFEAIGGIENFVAVRVLDVERSGSEVAPCEALFAETSGLLAPGLVPGAFMV